MLRVVAQSQESGAAAATVFGLSAILVLVTVVVWMGFSGLIGYLIGNGKGRGMAGFWLGALLGVIGWIIAALLEPSVEVEAWRAARVQNLLVQGQAASYSAPGWYADPWGVARLRYWDGHHWSAHTSE